MNNSKIQWINSDGGPLVLIPKTKRSVWQGVLDSEHYDSACMQEDYLSILNIQDTSVIILGDEPLPTFPIIEDQTLFIIRNYWLNDESHLGEYIKNIVTQYKNFDILETTYIKTDESEWEMFDSAYTFNDALEKVSITLPNLNCKIHTCKYETPDASSLIHIFLPNHTE